MKHTIFRWSCSVLAVAAVTTFGARDARAAADDELNLEPKGTAAHAAELRCRLRMLWPEDALRCLGRGSYAASTNIHGGMEFTGYHDTDSIDVIGPKWIFTVESPKAGWGIGGSFGIDVVTAASIDVVATASPRWQQARYEPSVYAHKTFGELGDFGIHGSMSISPGAWGKHLGASYSIDLASKRITPSIGYEFGHQSGGLSGAPYTAVSASIITHSITAAASFALGKATVLSLSGRGIFEGGDTSNPHRYIPMFSPDTVQNPELVNNELGPGAPIGNVNAHRLPIRGLEQLPTSRQRYAVTGSVLHRFSSSIFRMDVQFYADSWGKKAVTSNVSYHLDINDRFRIGPTAEFNLQTGTDFWQRLYTVTSTTEANGGTTVSVPQYRTGDRELGPLLGATGGFGARFAFGEERNWAVTLQGSARYTRYFDALYLQDNLALLAATGLTADFE